MGEREELKPKAPLLREIKRGKPEDKYIPITLVTGRGEISCRYYPVRGAYLGTIWVGGVGGDFDTPARGLYPKLSEALREYNIASLWVSYRHPASIEESVYDVMAGIIFLESEGIYRIALVGHSFGGAVVIQAAARSGSVKVVVALATQSYGAEEVSELSPDCSILLIHGADDTVLPSSNSRRVFEMAHEPKKLIILQENGHNLEKAAGEVEKLVREWVVSRLIPLQK
ncbi:MAG: dienelactone hydrolase family protein [Firmicutes bacterium]|nr:dienelactone hydrolase family protein [Bacillota bacterium]